jgi:hypothetical protein
VIYHYRYKSCRFFWRLHWTIGDSKGGVTPLARLNQVNNVADTIASRLIKERTINHVYVRMTLYKEGKIINHPYIQGREDKVKELPRVAFHACMRHKASDQATAVSHQMKI